MSQIIKARVEQDGSIHLLESVRLAQAVEVDVALPEGAIIETKSDTAATTTAPGVSTDIKARRLAWIQANREEYAGLYVALDDDRLVATGKTLPEAAHKAKHAGVEKPFLVRLTSETEVVFGGW
jgi:hypothetical protein